VKSFEVLVKAFGVLIKPSEVPVKASEVRIKASAVHVKSFEVSVKPFWVHVKSFALPRSPSKLGSDVARPRVRSCRRQVRSYRPRAHFRGTDGGRLDLRLTLHQSRRCLRSRPVLRERETTLGQGTRGGGGPAARAIEGNAGPVWFPAHPQGVSRAWVYFEDSA
jgi:hypothetical protein